MYECVFYSYMRCNNHGAIGKTMEKREESSYNIKDKPSKKPALLTSDYPCCCETESQHFSLLRCNNLAPNMAFFI